MGAQLLIGVFLHVFKLNLSTRNQVEGPGRVSESWKQLPHSK